MSNDDQKTADNGSDNQPKTILKSLNGQIGNRVGRINKLQARLDQEAKDSEAYKALQEKIDTLNAEIEERKKLREKLFSNNAPSIVHEKEQSDKPQAFNVLAQPKSLNSLPNLETLLFDARNYDSNKDKDFLDETMRTSNAAQTAPFNEPPKGIFTPPAGYGPLIGPVQVDPNLPPKEFFSKLRKTVPAIIGLATAALPAIAFKIACTTALTTFIPWVPVAVGLVSATYNLKKDYNRNKELDANFSAKQLLNRKSLLNAFGAGVVGAGTSFVGILGADALIDAFASEAACAATETIAPDPAPVVEAPTPEPEVAPEPEPEPEIIPEPTILTADQIIDPAMLLDLQQNDMEFIQNLVDHGIANNVDPALMDTLRSQLETGFDFIDSNASADAMAEFNALLEAAMDPTSPEGASVTAEEYTSILSGFIEQLNDPEIYKVDNVGVVDDTHLQASVRDSIINQGQTLRATI